MLSSAYVDAPQSTACGCFDVRSVGASRKGPLQRVPLTNSYFRTTKATKKTVGQPMPGPQGIAPFGVPTLLDLLHNMLKAVWSP